MDSLALSPESTTIVDGIRLSELADELPVGRSSFFELLKRLGVVSLKGPGPNGKGRVAWVSQTEANRLRAAAYAVSTGTKKIAEFSTALTKAGSAKKPSTGSSDSGASADAAPFLARLEAAERAVTSGLGLTTAETSWIFGVIPGSSPVTRGGLTATRTGKNCWILSKAP